MGLSDRDYAREPSSGFHLSMPQSGVGLLLAVNVVLYVVDVLLEGRLSERLQLHSDLFSHPWNCWQLLTAGFMHDPHSLWHILFNMIGLWLFGTDLERLYGRNEFLRIYVVAIIVGNLAWVASQTWLVPHPAGTVVGASGAVTCIWVLFALHFPTRMMLFGGFLPMPVWLLGLMTMVPQVLGFLATLRGVPSDTAFEAHLGGAVLALLYRRFNWNFGGWLPKSVTMAAPRLRPANRPKLKLHQPPTETVDLDGEVDRILAKISETGTDSLTPDERRTLERASARYQKRRT